MVKQARTAWYARSLTLGSLRLNAGKDHDGWNTEDFAREDVVKVAERSMESFEQELCDEMHHCLKAVYCKDTVLPSADFRVSNVCLDSEMR